MTFQDGIYWAVRARLQRVCFVVVYGGPGAAGTASDTETRQVFNALV